MPSPKRSLNGEVSSSESNVVTEVSPSRQGVVSFGESHTMHVVAISTQETEVRIESASRIFLDFINGGANKKNVQTLEDYIRNEVYKLCGNEEIKLNK